MWRIVIEYKMTVSSILPTHVLLCRQPGTIHSKTASPGRDRCFPTYLDAGTPDLRLRLATMQLEGMNYHYLKGTYLSTPEKGSSRLQVSSGNDPLSTVQ